MTWLMMLLSALLTRGVPGARESVVEIEGGADERQMRRRLREIAEVLCLRAQFFTA
jgi:hypothetical protein